RASAAMANRAARTRTTREAPAEGRALSRSYRALAARTDRGHLLGRSPCPIALPRPVSRQSFPSSFLVSASSTTEPSSAASSGCSLRQAYGSARVAPSVGSATSLLPTPRTATRSAVSLAVSLAKERTPSHQLSSLDDFVLERERPLVARLVSVDEHVV